MSINFSINENNAILISLLNKSRLAKNILSATKSKTNTIRIENNDFVIKLRSSTIPKVLLLKYQIPKQIKIVANISDTTSI